MGSQQERQPIPGSSTVTKQYSEGQTDPRCGPLRSHIASCVHAGCGSKPASCTKCFWLFNLVHRCLLEGTALLPGCSPRHAPVQGGVSLEHIDAHVLLHQAVQQDWEGGEADIVESQVCSIIQSLQKGESG